MEELADLLSKAVFGEIPFGGLDFCICEEVPAVFLMSDFLGLKVILQGYGGEAGYAISISPNVDFDVNDHLYEVNISNYVASLIKRIGLTVVTS